jgi:hypothetical protein
MAGEPDACVRRSGCRRHSYDTLSVLKAVVTARHWWNAGRGPCAAPELARIDARDRDRECGARRSLDQQASQ